MSDSNVQPPTQVKPLKSSSKTSSSKTPTSKTSSNRVSFDASVIDNKDVDTEGDNKSIGSNKDVDTKSIGSNKDVDTKSIGSNKDVDTKSICSNKDVDTKSIGSNKDVDTEVGTESKNELSTNSWPSCPNLTDTNIWNTYIPPDLYELVCDALKHLSVNDLKKLRNSPITTPVCLDTSSTTKTRLKFVKEHDILKHTNLCKSLDYLKLKYNLLNCRLCKLIIGSLRLYVILDQDLKILRYFNANSTVDFQKLLQNYKPVN